MFANLHFTLCGLVMLAVVRELLIMLLIVENIGLVRSAIVITLCVWILIAIASFRPTVVIVARILVSHFAASPASKFPRCSELYNEARYF